MTVRAAALPTVPFLPGRHLKAGGDVVMIARIIAMSFQRRRTA